MAREVLKNEYNSLLVRDLFKCGFLVKRTAI